MAGKIFYQSECLESGQSTTRPVQITNTDAGTLAWTASLVEGAPWLSFSPSNGTAPSTLTLTINAVNVQPGQYSGTVRVTAGAGVLNSPQDIAVSLTVTAPPFFVSAKSSAPSSRKCSSGSRGIRRTCNIAPRGTDGSECRSGDQSPNWAAAESTEVRWPRHGQLPMVAGSCGLSGAWAEVHGKFRR